MRVIWKGLLYSRRCLPNLISKRGSIEQGKFLLSSQESTLSPCATPGPNSMFHFLYLTSQSEVEWALGIVSSHIWSGDHLLTMATPIERLNAGKTAPVSNMCAQEKAQHVKYRYFTIPFFRFCCYTAGYLCFCGRLFMHCQLSQNSAKKTQIWIVPSHWVQISPYP